MKSIKLYFFLMLIMPSVASAQLVSKKTQHQIDSINLLIPIQKDTVKLKSYGTLNRILLNEDTELAKIYLDSLTFEAERIGNKKFIALALARTAYYYYQIGNFIKAEPYSIKAISAYRALHLKEPLSRALNVLGVVQKYLGKLKESMQSHLESLKLKEELNLQGKAIVGSYVNIGNLQAELRNLESSNAYYAKAVELCHNDELRRFLPTIWHNMGLNYQDAKEYSKASTYLLKAHIITVEQNHKPSIAKSLNSIGGNYMNMDSLATAKTYLMKSIKIGRVHGTLQLVGLALRNMGRIALKEEQFEKALEYFMEAKDISNETGTLRRGLDDYLNIAIAYARLGNYKAAYNYRETHLQKYDSIFKKENIEKLNELEVQYQTEKKESEIALQDIEIKTLNIKAKNDKLIKTLYSIGMLSFLTISGLLYFGFKQRIRKNSIAREKQEIIFKQEIAFKKKELTSQTLHLVQKNTFINELKENLEKIKKSPELFKVEFRRLVMLLKKESAEDKDWEIFKSYFSEVHNNFDNKLIAIHADISEKEIRLASFLRMNLSTKEIASMLNVLPESVLTSKYRLKKKLNLDKGTDLNQFLNTL